MSSLIEIIKAKISDKSELGDWYTDRLKVCLTCEFNSENKKVLTLKEKAIVAVNLGKPSCLGCGCEIAAKASVRTEDCGAVKKGQKSRWVKLETEEKEEFSVVCNNSNVKLSKVKDNQYIVNYGDIPFDSDSTVSLTIFKKDLSINKLTAQASCGCTGTTASFTKKNEIDYIIKYDTKRVGIFDKGTSLTIKDDSGKVYNLIINIKGKVNEL